MCPLETFARRRSHLTARSAGCPHSGLSAGQSGFGRLYLSEKDTCSEAVDRPYLRTQSAVKPRFCGSRSVIALFFRMPPRALPDILGDATYPMVSY